MSRIVGPEAAKRNERAARWSVATAVSLGLLKLGAAILTGSLSILASLVDSFMDLLASTVNYFAVRMAARPADEEHAYGHGKAEGLAGLIQGVVISTSGILLLLEAAERLTTEHVIEHTNVAIVVMCISTVASLAITRHLRRTAKATGSVALAADALHYASDIWTNLGVLAALVIMKFTGWNQVDGVVGAIVAAVVLWTALHVFRRSASELMDAGLTDTEQEELLGHVREVVPEVRGFERVRTRKSGPDLFIDCHVQFDRDLSFVEAHRLAVQVTHAFEAAKPGAHVVVHADPHPLLPSDMP